MARARGVAGLTRLPVTEEIAGSNPVGPARNATNDLPLAREVFDCMPRKLGSSNLNAKLMLSVFTTIVKVRITDCTKSRQK